MNNKLNILWTTDNRDTASMCCICRRNWKLHSREFFTFHLFLNTITVIFAGVTTKKAMLLRVIVQNFLSFFEPVQFDMFPNMKKETFESHIYRNQQIPVLKQAALFGPNGSGKSNFVKAVNFIQSIATQKNFLEKINISKYFFRLTESNNQPISMAIEFCKDEQYFIYIIDILPTRIK